MEPEPTSSNRTIRWIVGGLAAVVLAACACVLFLVASYFVGSTIIKLTQPVPSATANQPPEAISVQPAEAAAGEEVEFDGSESRPGSSPIISYQWNFGDGSTGSGIVVIHTYEAPGEYQVTLTVLDKNGLADTTDRMSITIR
jgi:PKD repeat protein